MSFTVAEAPIGAVPPPSSQSQFLTLALITLLQLHPTPSPAHLYCTCICYPDSLKSFTLPLGLCGKDTSTRYLLYICANHI
jgi:hypothetical protein